jgi:hypothetical protein
MKYYGYIFYNTWIISNEKDWNPLNYGSTLIFEFLCRKTKLPLTYPTYPKIGSVVNDLKGNSIEILNSEMLDNVKKIDDNVSGANEINVLILRNDRKLKLQKINKIRYDKK